MARTRGLPAKKPLFRRCVLLDNILLSQPNSVLWVGLEVRLRVWKYEVTCRTGVEWRKVLKCTIKQ
jgi:hypothetical protein